MPALHTPVGGRDIWGRGKRGREGTRRKRKKELRK